MPIKQKFKSEVFEVIHASASALLEVGAIDKTIMCQFDESCLIVPPVIDLKHIKLIRERNHVSQL